METQSVTVLLNRIRQDDADAQQELFTMLYKDLHRVAANLMRGERQNHTLQPTALVNEAYLKLFGANAAELQNREHFMAVASQAMRRLLVDHARGRKSAKRGAGAIAVTLEDALVFNHSSPDETLAVDQALTRLATKDPRLVKVVEMKYFGGLTEVEIAKALHLSDRTIKRDLKFAKAQLAAALSGNG